MDFCNNMCMILLLLKRRRKRFASE